MGVYGRSFGPSAGTDDYSMYLTRTDASGNHLWSKAIGGSDNDYLFDMKVGSDGFYLAGYTYSYGPSAGSAYSGMFVKTDTTGSLIAARAIGGADYDYFRNIDFESDGDIALFGYTRTYGPGATLDDYSMMVISITSSFSFVQAEAIGCNTGYNTYQYGGVVSPGDGYVMGGYTQCFGVPTTSSMIVGLDSDMISCVSSSSFTPTIQSITPTVQTFTPTVQDISAIVSYPSVSVVSSSISANNECP